MTSKELYAALEAAGWAFGPALNPKEDGVSWYAYQRLIGGNDCECNDKPPSVCIKLVDFEMGSGKRYQSSTFEIAGELPTGKWVSFSVYGLAWEDVVPQSDECVAVLLTAWNSVSGKGE